jgi:DNA excision repair protein ERCC-8
MDSMPSLLYQRSTGKRHPFVFRDEIAIHKRHLELLDNLQVASPHTGPIPALQVDRIEGRFLLSGSSDATVCIYDLSKWGTDEFLSGKTPSARSNVYKPVARSVRVPFSGELETPHGHSHAVEAVQWYPIDTGAFISASADGTILVWDTHGMEPVIQWHPLVAWTCPILKVVQIHYWLSDLWKTTLCDWWTFDRARHPTY